MRRVAIYILTVFTAPAYGQEQLKTKQIDSVVVAARRILHEVGVQKTVLDTISLRDNVTVSMADVLTRSSTVFIKSYGRATLSTASFRGTAPSHTTVTWNGMKVNSPMLGMVDFSTIPSYFIDRASLYHGASSVGLTGGGLGGAVAMQSAAEPDEGFSMRYIEGVGSYRTFDEFLQLGYARKGWYLSTRAALSSSANDFKYTNYHKKSFIYDDGGNITGFGYPVERNSDGDFCDLHIMQEAGYNSPRAGRWSMAAWYFASSRGLHKLNVDYRDANLSSNRLNENTLRATVSWDKVFNRTRLSAGGGYTYTDMLYIYKGDRGGGVLQEMTHSQNYVNTFMDYANVEYTLSPKWLFTAAATSYQHNVKSRDRAIITSGSNPRITGYDQSRFEMSGLATVRWKPDERWGFSMQLREELCGESWSSPIVAGFAEYLLSRRGNILLKTSATRNYRFPTLNDLYFVPGGNPHLLPEEGFSCDGGIAAHLSKGHFEAEAEATAYNSYIDNWILWRPVAGYWSAVNIARVHSFGIELKGKLKTHWGHGWQLDLDGNFTLSRAINRGEPVGDNDLSVGRQLEYIPLYSGAANGHIGWRSWALGYSFCHYGVRYTSTSNYTDTRLDNLPPYFMNDLSLEKRFSPRWAHITLKLKINNLFDEEYESELRRPMAGRNYGFFVEIVPRF